jgi:1-acyl-sn-glycerol-3-phosphate acyltransferase
MSPKASRLRQGLRWARVLLHLLLGLGMVLLRYPQQNLAQQRATRQRWCRQFLHCMGVQMHESAPQAEAMAQPTLQGQLLVANHISWLDIVVLNACVNTDFVAKEEVRSWGIFGWIAAQNGTIFLSRHSPTQARVINLCVAERLRQGQSVLVFPEGSTSLGLGVLPFHPAMFQAAIDADSPVQPLALIYTDADGVRSTAAAYAGETTLWQSLRRIMAAPALHARVRHCPVLAPDAQRQRRRLAHSARALIVAQTQLPIQASENDNSQTAHASVDHVWSLKGASS